MPLSGSVGVGGRAAFAAILKNTWPDELRDATAQKSLEEFLTLYGEGPLLVFYLGDATNEVAAGLPVPALRDAASVATEPPPTPRGAAHGAGTPSAALSAMPRPFSHHPPRI